ncbi:MAG: transcriptional repressor [Candidatus Pacebacteria bacterium]|nr:transcriptional repressor [Candidatus Paceibacterota bacterium]
MRELLKEKGYKATPARLAILEIFTESAAPLTAENIYKELKRNKKNKDINEATVYRTLATLEEGEIIKKVDFRKNASFFELAKEHHHHITCLKCDTIEDFESTTVEKALEGIVRNSSKFINIRDHSLELFGFCKNCIA